MTPDLIKRGFQGMYCRSPAFATEKDSKTTARQGLNNGNTDYAIGTEVYGPYSSLNVAVEIGPIH